MATNLALDDRLIVLAQRIGGHRTKWEAVTEALKEYIAYRRQKKIINLFGQIDFDPHYDYKKHRKRR